MRRILSDCRLIFTVSLLVIGALHQQASVAWGGSLSTWLLRNTTPQGNTINGIAYGNNTFVAVGDGGTILTSTDGVTWTQRTSGKTVPLQGVAYGNNAFVVIGNGGAILTSPDGAIWAQGALETTQYLSDIAYGNNVFVAVATGGVIFTSPDGGTWTQRTVQTTNLLYHITYGNNTFMAVAGSGNILTSADGLTWMQYTTGTTSWLMDVAYGNNTFVAVGAGGAIITSTDGVSWTPQTSETTNMFYAIIYDNNIFVAVGDGGVIFTSTNGVTWMPRNSGTTNSLKGIASGTNTFVSVGSGSTILQSAPLGLYGLTVAKAGTGGAVISAPSGISCGNACSADYASGTQVTLTAVPDANSVFAGWSGECSGRGQCTATVDADKSVTAIFISATALQKLGLMRALSMGGNWGGNIDGIKNLPDAYIQSLHDDHINWVGIKVSIFNESISDPTVKVRYRLPKETNYASMYTYDDNDLINAITKLKQQGMNVYLSLVLMQPSEDQAVTCNTAQYGVDSHLFGDPELPTINNSSAWGYECINPSFWWWSPSHPDYAANVATFWSTYTQVAVKYATMAQQLGVGMFALGEETDRLFRTRSSTRFPINFKNELSQMVASVRAEYKGLLTYGQQSFVNLPHPEWWGLDTAASSSLFKDLGLDVIGISAAYSLVNSSVNRVYSVAELETYWASVFKTYLVPLQASNPNTPIIFSDIASVNTINAPYMPLSQSSAPYVFSDSNGNGIDDGMEQQSNFFQALLNVNKSYSYLLRGTVFAWSLIDTDPNVAIWYQTHRDIQIHGKPAEQAIRKTYCEWTRGDLNGDGFVNLTDAVLSLQIMSGMKSNIQTISGCTDVNGSGKIGSEDAIFILQTGAEMR